MARAITAFADLYVDDGAEDFYATVEIGIYSGGDAGIESVVDDEGVERADLIDLANKALDAGEFDHEIERAIRSDFEDRQDDYDYRYESSVGK